ncbi:hypothetical protein CDL12_20400 [Handroanthus impetiginosus]|uniref:Uncharacterized protein n=1 Tax=Handroanthus impetiginosus TaxID=429701 RepID=A0A2G9GP08_9LAMI|nr:hypothetical protein CDL12_20400 [Handroanthus impetiginosus]
MWPQRIHLLLHHLLQLSRFQLVSQLVSQQAKRITTSELMARTLATSSRIDHLLKSMLLQEVDPPSIIFLEAAASNPFVSSISKMRCCLLFVQVSLEVVANNIFVFVAFKHCEL